MAELDIKILGQIEPVVRSVCLPVVSDRFSSSC
jgi:hypothetical protein